MSEVGNGIGIARAMVEDSKIESGSKILLLTCSS